MKEILIHHVGLARKAIAEGRSPEEEVERILRRYPKRYKTDVAEETTKLIQGMRELMETVASGNFVEVDDIRNETVPDLLCEVCPPSCQAAKECYRKLGVAVNLRAQSHDGMLTKDDIVDLFKEEFLPRFMINEGSRFK